MIAFLVTHLMGAGHLVRTLALARAVAARGGRARVISGGRPLAQVDAAGVELVQLPWVASDGLDYRRLLGPDGREADAGRLAARRAAILGALEGAEALVTELWPFGRRILGDEFRAAVAAMGDRPVWASIRDVLEPPSKPARVAETLAALEGFRGVLVHGDPAVAPLAASWPAEEAVRGLVYTGYVSDPAPAAAGPAEVMVAVGGGVIGRRLLGVAAEAAGASRLPWRLRVGGADAAEVCVGLAGRGPAAVEPAAGDYRARLGAAAASVSLCGYNTAVEVALSGTPALLVPMEEAGEREQLIRAGAFARLEGLETARIGDLTPERLAARVEALAAGPRRAPALAAEGAVRAAEILLAG